MPQKRTDETPPETMTWAKTSPVLVAALIFDAIRLMFEWFWFFGPAFATLYCTAKASDYVGTAVGGLLCATAGTAGGVIGAPMIVPFGVVMATATGLFGWLTIGLWLKMRNPRIFRENTLWFVVSLAVSETPIVGSIPALTLTLWKMFSNQIRIERVALKKWEADITGEALQRRQRQAQALAQHQAQSQSAERADQEAANDATFQQEEAGVANDAQYTQETREAA